MDELTGKMKQNKQKYDIYKLMCQGDTVLG